MVDVFISYARENQAIVRQLADAVRREGYRVWWDEEIPPHLAYGDVIAEKIGSAKAAIVVWSADAASSEWVRAEADVARGQKKLIQTSVDDREPPMPFNQIQVAGIGDWRGEDDHPGWRRVRQSLAALCGPGSTDVAANAPPITVPPPKPLPRPRQRTGSQRMLVSIIGVLALIVAIGGGYLWSLTRLPGPDDVVVAAAVPPDPISVGAAAPDERETAAMPPTAAFTQRATVVDRTGSANVRSGPTAISPIVGQVDGGQTVATYPQTGDWWQVHTDSGLFGYINRSSLRIEAPAAPPPRPEAARQARPTAPVSPPVVESARPGAPAPRPQADDGRNRIPPTGFQEANRRRYCAGAGFNTPRCRQLRQRAAIRPY